MLDPRSVVLEASGPGEAALSNLLQLYLHDLSEVFPIEDEETGERIEDPVERVRRVKRPVRSERQGVLVQRGGGARIPVEESGAPIWSEDGRLVGAVLVFRDVSERKEAERRQAELLENERLAKQEAEAALIASRQVFEGTAHH